MRFKRTLETRKLSLLKTLQWIEISPLPFSNSVMKYKQRWGCTQGGLAKKMIVFWTPRKPRNWLIIIWLWGRRSLTQWLIEEVSSRLLSTIMWTMFLRLRFKATLSTKILINQIVTVFVPSVCLPVRVPLSTKETLRTNPKTLPHLRSLFKIMISNFPSPNRQWETADSPILQTNPAFLIRAE